ncbi:hypothetical protein BDV19DRAFT_386070 [Aspergillus venezuelensis]
MLAADMGISSHEIPFANPDAEKFLPFQISADQHFDFAICASQSLRQYSKPRPSDERASMIHKLSQLNISLTHLKPGGRMIILLYELASPDSVLILNAMDKFANLRLFKSTEYKATWGKSYGVATNVRSDSKEAGAAIDQWRNAWRCATFAGGSYMRICQALADE